MVVRRAPVNPGTKKRLRAIVYLRDGGRCVYCGSSYRLTLDHDTPLAKGGTWDESNLVTACYSCNSQKARLGNMDGFFFRIWIAAHPAFVASNLRGKRRRKWHANISSG